MTLKVTTIVWYFCSLVWCNMLLYFNLIIRMSPYILYIYNVGMIWHLIVFWFCGYPPYDLYICITIILFDILLYFGPLDVLPNPFYFFCDVVWFFFVDKRFGLWTFTKQIFIELENKSLNISHLYVKYDKSKS
jgi:hypothetical protein